MAGRTGGTFSEFFADTLRIFCLFQLTRTVSPRFFECVSYFSYVLQIVYDMNFHKISLSKIGVKPLALDMGSMSRYPDRVLVIRGKLDSEHRVVMRGMPRHVASEFYNDIGVMF